MTWRSEPAWLLKKESDALGDGVRVRVSPDDEDADFDSEAEREATDDTKNVTLTLSPARKAQLKTHRWLWHDGQVWEIRSRGRANPLSNRVRLTISTAT